MEGVEREDGQGECDIKKMQAEVECLRRKAVRTGWSTEKEQASEEAMHRAKDVQYAVRRCVYPLIQHVDFSSATS